MNYLTKSGVSKIFNLSSLFVRGMFERSDFPKQKIKIGNKQRTVVEANDLITFFNYTGILKNVKIKRLKYSGKEE